MNSTELNRDHVSRYCKSDDVWAAFLNGEGTAHQEAREELFHRHSDLAEAMAGKYIRITPAHKVDPEDLRSAAFEGLLFSIDNFDPNAVATGDSLDHLFRRYASRCIFGYVMTEMHTQDTLPRNLSDQVREFRRQSEELAQLMGRTPTGDELREALGCRNEKRFQLLESLSDYLVNQESLPPDEGGPDEPDVSDWVVSHAIAAAEGYDPISVDDPYTSTELRMFQEQLNETIASLPVLQQQLIWAHYFRDETLTRVAMDIGLARQTISQHHQRALTQLGQTLRERGYGEDALPAEWGGY